MVHSGVFVAKQAAAVRDAHQDVLVDVPQVFPAPPGPVPKAVTAAMRTLALRSPDAAFARSDQTTYLPTAVPAKGGIMGRARAMKDTLMLLDELRHLDCDIVHAHLGLPTGWAVAESMQEVPLVVTEHQSTLRSVLADPTAAEAYADVVRNSDAFVCVSEHLRDQVVAGVGAWAREHIEVIPNIVDLTHIPFRQRSGSSFSSWIYVGGLLAHKGVQTLIRAFFIYRKRYESAASLTLVGEGPLRKWIEDFARRNRMTGAVNLVGSVPHSDLGPLLDAADVMVHLSQEETFGIAPLEGIGAGLPVIALRNQGTANTWADLEDLAGSILPLSASPGAVAEGVASLRNQAARLDGAKARQAVIDRYSARIVGGRLIELYKRVLR